ncbi:MAG: Rpn family recombination-promoting nuclease/putative transposase [Oscillospiraceae bacterium]|nr:Rpn family recombination-promoting nuclease/putative transposase [Oscillospiraceae bacterium]
MGEKFISAKLDIVFKMLFAENEDILREFLSDILDIPIEKIKGITVLNPEILPESVGERSYRLDLLLNVDGKFINIEMQVRSEKHFGDRILVYWSKMYSKQLDKGESYNKLRPCIVITIVNFDLFDHSDYHSEFGVWDVEHNNKLSDKMAIHFFELNKLPGNIDKSNRKELWLRFIKADDKEAFDMLENANVEGIKKGIQAVYKMSADERTKELIRMRENALHLEATLLEDAREEGMEKGLEKGRTERESEIIENMRALGMSENEIQKIIGG